MFVLYVRFSVCLRTLVYPAFSFLYRSQYILDRRVAKVCWRLLLWYSVKYFPIFLVTWFDLNPKLSKNIRRLAWYRNSKFQEANVKTVIAEAAMLTIRCFSVRFLVLFRKVIKEDTLCILHWIYFNRQITISSELYCLETAVDRSRSDPFRESHSTI